MRLPLTRPIVAALAVATSLTAVPAMAAPPTDAVLPVLWEGQVRDPGGLPAAGAEVVAFLRPPTYALVPNVPLVPLARTATNRLGRFSLRSLPTPAVASVTDEVGRVTVLLAAFTDDGMSMAVDTVAWQPRPKRWATTPGDLAAGGAARKAAAFTSASERPAVLTTVPFRSPSGADQDEAHPPTGAGSCWLTGAKDLGREMVTVGELHLDRAWGGKFAYTQTKDSSFQIGVSHESGPWKAGGSIGMSKNFRFGVPVEIPHADNERFWLWKAEMDYKRFAWGCNKGYPDVHHAETLEPVAWTGTIDQVADGGAPTCNPKYRARMPANARPERLQGESVTLTRAISLPGFTGSMTSGFSTGVQNAWYNLPDRSRSLCGETAVITRETRVRSEA